jgi:Glycosyltransferase family 87
MTKITHLKSRKYLNLLVSLIAASWLTALAWLLSIPADPKNAVLMGLSPARLVLAGFGLLMTAAAVFLLFMLRRRQELVERFAAALCHVPVFVGEYVAFVLVGLLFAATFVLDDAGRLAAYTLRLRPLLLGGTINLGLFLLYPAVFDRGALSYTKDDVPQSEVQSVPVWQPPLVLAFILLLIYLAAGAYTEGIFMQAKPLPRTFQYDFGYYSNGLQAALAGESPYANLSLGTGFLYPLPSLLVVEIFAHLPVLWLRQALYLLFNLALMCAMLWGVARHYRLSLRQVWWWFPLVLGFAPTLEMLHAGQINMITEFGLFLLFIWEASRPAWAGMGLALGIVTKFSPFLFLPYLLANRHWKTALAALAGVAILSGLAVLRYGWAPLVEYGRVFGSLMERLPMGKNPQSLVSKFFMQQWMNFDQAWTTHRLLTFYFALLLCLSALCAYLRRVREPFFIIAALSMMLSANIIWYHHYVFFLLPLLIWMAWKRLDPKVVAWCFGGLLVIQLDRWLLTYGLLAHIFGHLTILWLLAGQFREVVPMMKKQEISMNNSSSSN